jgi:hypothetical protein
LLDNCPEIERDLTSDSSVGSDVTVNTRRTGTALAPRLKAEHPSKLPGGQVTTATAIQTSERRRVRVWFGEHVIADYNAEPALAERYADAMSRRFAGLRVTNDPMPAVDKLPDPLPGERMWDVAPR